MENQKVSHYLNSTSTLFFPSDLNFFLLLTPTNYNFQLVLYVSIETCRTFRFKWHLFSYIWPYICFYLFFPYPVGLSSHTQPPLLALKKSNNQPFRLLILQKSFSSSQGGCQSLLLVRRRFMEIKMISFDLKLSLCWVILENKIMCNLLWPITALTHLNQLLYEHLNFINILQYLF